MSRLRNTVRSLVSGYAAMGSNVLYTLASIPLALRYLPQDEFGLWALVTQITGYLVLIDVASSLSRILIDHKDTRSDGQYGAVIQAGCLVLIVQGACVALLGVGLSFWLPKLLDVPARLAHIFRVLVAAQCILLGGLFVGRVLMYILQAHQRFDVLNYGQIGQLAIGFAAQWLAFHKGSGLYSLLVASVASTLCGFLINAGAVLWLGLLPSKGTWGRPTYAIFRHLFGFGGELLLLSIGYQLANASQVIIVSRTLGLTAAAVWAIATKTFVLGQQVVLKIFSFSGSALGEMVVRGERERLKRRFRDVLLLTTSFGVFVGVSIAVCNGSFLAAWLKPTFSTADIREVASFSNRLKEHSDPVSKYLWDRLSETAKQKVLQGTETNAFLQGVSAELNTVIKGGSIFAAERFAGVKLSEETRALLSQDVRGIELMRRNRLLLEDAYPQELAKSIRWRVAWPWHDDALMGFWIILSCVTLCHVGLTGPIKQIGAMRYVYFLEGATFVTSAFLIARHTGMTGIICAAILADVIWSGGYGFWRTAQYFGTSVGEPLFSWLRPAYLYLVIIAPLGALLEWATFRMAPLERLMMDAGLMIVLGPTLMWRVGLTQELRRELKERFSGVVPSWGRKVVGFLITDGRG